MTNLAISSKPCRGAPSTALKQFQTKEGFRADFMASCLGLAYAEWKQEQVGGTCLSVVSQECCGSNIDMSPVFDTQSMRVCHHPQLQSPDLTSRDRAGMANQAGHRQPLFVWHVGDQGRGQEPQGQIGAESKAAN